MCVPEAVICHRSFGRTRKSADLVLGMEALLSEVGCVPRRLIWDNEAGSGRGKLTKPAALFAGTLATKMVELDRWRSSSGQFYDRSKLSRSMSFWNRALASSLSATTVSVSSRRSHAAGW